MRLNYNFVIFTKRRKKILVPCLFGVLFNFSVFFFNFKGEILYNGFFKEENVMYTDSYVIDFSTCYVQLLLRCYYNIDSSVDHQGSVLFYFQYSFCSPGFPAEFRIDRILLAYYLGCYML